MPWLAAVIAPLPACGTERAGTEVLVVIDSDLQAGSELAHVDVDVVAADGQGALLGGQGFDVAAPTSAQSAAFALPLSFGVAPSGGTSSRAFRVVVRGLAAGAASPSVTAHVIGRFVPGESRRLDVFLARACRGVPCQTDASGVALTTCVAGSCVPVPESSGVPRAGGDDLGGYVSTVVGSTDAAVADAAALDAGSGGADGAVSRDASVAPDPGDGSTPPPPADGGADAGDPVEQDGGPGEPPADAGPPDAGPCTPPTSCPQGSTLSGCACVDIDECSEPAATAVCAPTGHPCAETSAPGYTCLGHRADWPMPDVVSGAVAAPSYALVGNGENALVTDRVTGLVWQARPGRAENLLVISYAQAEAVCAATNIGGLSFRLPSLIELVSILDPSRGAAGVSNLLADRTYFQGVAADYWTSTPDPREPAQHRTVSFSDGSIAAVGSAVASARVRCVASAAPVPSGTPATRLAALVSNGQTAGYFDRRTGLGWATNVSPVPLSYAEAIAYCAALQTGADALRLPSYKELLTALRLGPTGPYWDPELSTAFSPLWSGTLVAGDATRAYLVDFSRGTGGTEPTTALAYARCVKALP